MNVLIAPNTFKGSLDAFAVADAIAEGFARVMPNAVLMRVPIADGGDGTARVLVNAVGGELVPCEVEGSLGEAVTAEWAALADGESAVIEVARACGLELLSPGRRDPLRASSYGAGELVVAAVSAGRRKIVVALGGSATVDGGAGFLEALGVRFLDAKGTPIARGGGGLGALDRIDVSGIDPRLAGVEMVVACDVDNPLLASRGAARTFGPQKGATPAMVDVLEANLAHLADVIQRDCGRDVRNLAHGGAAGGMAAGLAGILGAQLASGSELVLERVRFDERLDPCDLVITGEGFLDRQTLGNKAPYAVARAARRRGRPVIALVGGVADDASGGDLEIFDAVVPICPRPLSLDDAMRHARSHVARAAEQVARVLRIGIIGAET